MKKYLSFGVLAIAISAVFSGCSKSTDLYDQAAVEKQQQEQKVAELKKAYNDAFTKAFGTIDSNNAWGFDKTRGAFTREASNSELTDLWIIPENIFGGSKNKEGWNANAIEADFANGGANLNPTLTDFDFSNYFIQHVEKPNNNEGWVKQSIDILQAWNSDAEAWQDVDHFKHGDTNATFETLDENFYFKNNPNSTAQVTTLMKNMGGATCNQNDENGSANSIGKMFRLVRTINGATTYDYNYTIQWQKNWHKKPQGKFFTEPIVAFGLENGEYWVMRLGVAQNTTKNVMAEGRILCEDMGANDFDFNDVVFDAKIMGNGEIKITVWAHGGELDIYIDEQKVTLPPMTNTGLADAEVQDITIPAKTGGEPKYTDINLIPVRVVPNGIADNAYDLTAVKGQAPQKVCVPIGIDWPDEYVGISRAYSPFESYVNISTMDDWMFEVNDDLVDGDMSNNN